MTTEIKMLDDSLAPHFARLNRAWIERLYVIEPADEVILASPQQLVDEGGAVLFLLVDDEVVGTGGLQKLDEATAEVVKMAVAPAHQGKGLGGRVMAALLDEARRLGFQRAYIETNGELAAANGMYLKYGFTPTGQQASLHGYARADVFYELQLNQKDC
ncbi:GNAT family N-acetyltransferase [Opitutaceae bacterium]|nr:GNAT family N-acetyltransferase [Opitutaceae bacterium]